MKHLLWMVAVALSLASCGEQFSAAEREVIYADGEGIMRVLSIDNEADGGEGCLSVPELYGNVSRWQEIVLRYRDEQFVEHTERIEGFTAVIFQHEIDHLHGRLFVDYLSEEAFDEAIEE